MRRPSSWWALALLALAAALLAGCQGSPEPTPEAATAGPTRVVLWHAYRAEEEAAINQAVEALNASRQDLRVEIQKIPYNAFADKITTAIPRDNGPDLFIFAHDRIGDWAEADLIEPISIWAPQALLDGYIKSTVEALVYKRALYGLPLTFKSVALFYNTALVDSPPTTEAELLDKARAATDPAQKRYGLAYPNSQLYFSAPFIHGFGGQTLDIDGKLRLADPGTAAGLGFAQALVHEHKVVPDDVDGAVVTNLFNSGRAAMVINGPWFIGEIAQEVTWKVAPLPKVTATGLPMSPFFGSEAVMMSRRARDKKATFEVMQFLAGAEGARIRMTVGGQPAAFKATWQEVEATETQRVFRRQIDEAIFMPNISDMRLVWGPTDEAITRIVKRKADPSAELARAQERIEASR